MTVGKINGFQVAPLRLDRAWVTPPLHVLPELGALGGLDATIAVVSAVAGAAAQMPRLMALEEEKKALQRELEIAKSSLSESEAKLVERVTELENALFEIDREYEGQTARMKKKFDMQLKEELNELATRLKRQYTTNTERLKDAMQRDTELQKVELSGKLRQDFLQEKLNYINEMSGTKRDQLSSILQEQAQIKIANQELEAALAASRKELEDIQNMSKKPFGWWPFGRN